MTPADTPKSAVTHNRSDQCFEVVSDGHRSELTYVVEGDRVAFTHTFVPPELRGRGLAEQLVRPALAWARAEKLRVVPQCSYVAAFITRHVEFRDLLE